MARVLELLIEKQVTPRQVVDWLEDLHDKEIPDVLAELQHSRGEFVPVFLNLLRDQANSLLLSSAPSATPNKQCRGTFPLSAVKYISPRKAEGLCPTLPGGRLHGGLSGGGRVPGGRLHFTPARAKTLSFQDSSGHTDKNANEGAPPAAYDLDQLLLQDTCETSMSKSQQAYPKPKLLSPLAGNTGDNSWKLSPSLDCSSPAVRSRSQLTTSTPRQAMSTPKAMTPHYEDSSYENRPANWNRRQTSAELDSSFGGDCCYSSYNTNKYNGGRNSGDVKYSEQRNCLQDYIVTNAKKSNNKKKNTSAGTTSNNSSTNNASHGSLKMSCWEGNRKSRTSLDISDTDTFPAMSQSSATKTEKSKKRRVKPTRVPTTQSLTAEEMKDGKKLTQIKETTTVFIDVKDSNDRSLDQERQLLQQMKAKMSKGTFSANIAKEIQEIEKEIDTKPIDNNFKNVKALDSETDTSTTFLDSVTHIDTLDNLISVYADLVLYNHVPSLMMELYFTFQLLTIRGTTNIKYETHLYTNYFSSTHNCVYFAARFLSSVTSILKLLDRTTLRLLAENKRVQVCAPELHQYLVKVVDTNPPLPSPKPPPRSPMKAVPFQADTDNRANFPDNTTFHIFRKQRDLFYELLREWEREHEQPNWNLSARLGPKIRALLELGPDPSNVAHLARLYVAQLLSMCEASHMAPLQQEDGGSVLSLLKRQHPEKFQRLQQRMTAPSRIVGGPVPPPCFPGVQQLFRGLLLEAYNPTLYAHLEDHLVAKLLDLLGAANGEHHPAPSRRRSRVSLWLRQAGVLGKFIGLLWFSSYHSSLTLPQPALAKQVACRSKRCLSLSLCKLLRSSAARGHLVAGVVTCVQLLSVADAVALHTAHLQTAVFVLRHIYKMALCYSQLPNCCHHRTEDNSGGLAPSVPKYRHQKSSSGTVFGAGISKPGPSLSQASDTCQAPGTCSEAMSEPCDSSCTDSGTKVTDNCLRRRRTLDFNLHNRTNFSDNRAVNEDEIVDEIDLIRLKLSSGSDVNNSKSLLNPKMSVISNDNDNSFSNADDGHRETGIPSSSNTATLGIGKAAPVPNTTNISSEISNHQSSDRHPGQSIDTITNQLPDNEQRTDTLSSNTHWNQRLLQSNHNQRPDVMQRLDFVFSSNTGSGLTSCSVPVLHDRVSCSSSKTMFSPEVSMFLRLLLGWLFDLPIFPDGLFHADPMQTDMDVEEYTKSISLLTTLYTTPCYQCMSKCSHLSTTVDQQTCSGGTTPFNDVSMATVRSVELPKGPSSDDGGVSQLATQSLFETPSKNYIKTPLKIFKTPIAAKTASTGSPCKSNQTPFKTPANKPLQTSQKTPKPNIVTRILLDDPCTPCTVGDTPHRTTCTAWDTPHRTPFPAGDTLTTVGDTPYRTSARDPHLHYSASPLVTITFQETPEHDKTSVQIARPPSPPLPSDKLDEYLTVDYQLLQEWCPQLGELRALLTTYSVGGGGCSSAGGVRKITPVTAVSVPPKPSNCLTIEPSPPLQETTAASTAAGGKGDTSAHKEIQNQLEECFFHHQSSNVRESVQFVIEQLVSNSVRQLRSSIIPEAARHIAQLQDALEQHLSSHQHYSASQIEAYATDLVHGATLDLRASVRASCLLHLQGQLQQQRQVLQLLLPPDTTDQATTVCCDVVHRACDTRVRAWLASNLNQAAPATVISPSAARIVRAAMRELNRKAFFGSTLSQGLQELPSTSENNSAKPNINSNSLPNHDSQSVTPGMCSEIPLSNEPIIQNESHNNLMNDNKENLSDSARNIKYPTSDNPPLEGSRVSPVKTKLTDVAPQVPTVACGTPHTSAGEQTDAGVCQKATAMGGLPVAPVAGLNTTGTATVRVTAVGSVVNTAAATNQPAAAVGTDDQPTARGATAAGKPSTSAGSSAPARPGSDPARPGSAPARPGPAPARPGSAPARPQLSIKAGGPTHDPSAPAPSVLMAELKNIVKAVLSSARSGKPPQIWWSTPLHHYIEDRVLPLCSKKQKLSDTAAPSTKQSNTAASDPPQATTDGVYRDRVLPQCSSHLMGSHLRGACRAITDCVQRRGDLTSPALKALKALSVDVLLIVGALYPQLLPDETVAAYLALWVPGAVLEAPATLQTTALSPRVVQLVESCVQRGILSPSSCCSGLQRIMTACLGAGLLSRATLQEQSVALLQHCWSQDVLHSLSALVQGLDPDPDSVMSWIPWLCEEMENMPDY